VERPANYEELVGRFRWSVPERFNIAWDRCGRHARDRSRFALYYEDETGFTRAYTFWDIQQEANRLSNALAALGVKQGERVAIILPQRPESGIAHIAVSQMGAVALPLSFLFGPDALQYRLEDSGACVAIVDEASLPKLSSVREQCPALRHVIGVGGARETATLSGDALLAKASRDFTPVDTRADDPAMIIYTSGTTGTSKIQRRVLRQREESKH
jgi:acetyl-CoA synthetase